MAEIAVADVDAYSGGRLAANNPEVAKMLAAALSVARRYTGWHVSPVLTETVVIDGPDSRILWLPTLKVVALTSVKENEVTVDPATITRSVGDAPGLARRQALRKRGGGYWTAEYAAIELTLEHGYTETEAADWRRAVLAMVDQMSLAPVKAATGASGIGLTGMRVDDVDYRYNPYAASAEEALFGISNVLDDYRLPPVELF